MNKFFSLLALAAVAFTAPLQAATVQTNLTDATEVTTDNFAAKGYTVEVLAVHRDGNRAFFSGRYKTLHQAQMAYQTFVFELPDGATVIYARITDSRGRIIHSIDN